MEGHICLDVTRWIRVPYVYAYLLWLNSWLLISESGS